MWKKTRGTLMVGAFTMITVGILNSQFSGMVAARLPFIPFKIFTNVTHYGIAGNDYRDTGTVFLFMVTNISIG